MYMTNEEAVEILKGAIKKPNTKDGYLGQAIDMAIKALEQESTEDCISRAYIESIVEELENICINGDEYVLSLFSDIKNAPSVTPHPKIGHWIYTPEKWLPDEIDERCIITDYRCTCSECGGDFGFQIQKMSDAYCKYCGAKMEVEE